MAFVGKARASRGGAALSPTMIDMSNDTHVSDVVLFVHELTDLVNRAAKDVRISRHSIQACAACVAWLRICNGDVDSMTLW